MMRLLPPAHWETSILSTGRRGMKLGQGKIVTYNNGLRTLRVRFLGFLFALLVRRVRAGHATMPVSGRYIVYLTRSDHCFDFNEQVFFNGKFLGWPRVCLQASRLRKCS